MEPRRPAAASDRAGTNWPVHELSLGPEELPAIRAFDLDRAWQAARRAALDQRWSQARLFRFCRADGSLTELLLADPDAGCWAGAVDRLAGLASVYGAALCLRLLALVDLLAHAPALAALCRFAHDGAELDPRLLRLAATTPLSPEARFDAALFGAALAPTISPVAIPRLPEPAR